MTSTRSPSAAATDAPSSSPPRSTPRPQTFPIRLAGIGRLDLPGAVKRLPLGVLLMVGLAVATVWVVSHIPVRERLRTQARIGAVLSAAPVLLVGDSISYLAAPRQLCGEAVFNASVPGDRIADLVADAREYAPRPQAKRVVIAVGVNDAWSRHRTIDAWIADYRRLVTLYAGHDLVLVEINPPELTRQRFPKRLDLDFIAQANEAIRAIAARTQARLVPAPTAVDTRDGLHPTAAGTELWRMRLAQAACI